MLDDTFPGLCETLWMEMLASPPLLSIVGVLADYLEGRSDPRAEGLRRMRLINEAHDESSPNWYVGPIDWGQAKPGHGPAILRTEAAATRELLRRAWEMVTVECDGPDELGCVISPCVCSGRQRVPAWVEKCGECGGRGTVKAAYRFGDTIFVPPGMMDSVSSKESACVSPLLSLRVVEDPSILDTTCPACHGERWMKRAIRPESRC